MYFFLIASDIAAHENQWEGTLNAVSSHIKVLFCTKTLLVVMESWLHTVSILLAET